MSCSHHFLAPIATGSPEIGSLYAAMLAIWHLRPATQRRFPLQHGRPRDRLRFLAWCATDGRREYQILREIPVWDQELTAHVALPELANDRWARTFSLMNFLHGVALHRWSLSGMLGRADSRDRAARHFWRGARHRSLAPGVEPWQRNALAETFGSPAKLARAIAMKKHAASSDEARVKDYGLEELTESSCEPASTGFQSIVLPEHLARSPFPLPQPIARWIDPLLQDFRHAPTQAESVQVTSQIDTTPTHPVIKSGTFGVNLIGFARGELGIGEDIRHVALVLRAEGIPVCILDFAPGKNISQADEGAKRLMSDKPLYGINLFCLTGIETTRYVCERGLSTLTGRYNIGLWPWELPDWPENCRHAYACIDEIWGISEFTANAHRFAAPRPVMPMGLPVELGPVGKQTRQDFGLPDDAYLYCFAFDINSSAARKNPEGLIAAFQKAFPLVSREKVGLVLKVSHPETGCAQWKRIRRAAKKDPRIHLIERTMRRPELMALINACDCYASLHRGEGFGRCLAEALLLEKQIIATGFSGNMDFCHEPRVALVRHTMRAVRTGEYMWSEGQSWAEPEIDHAADLMRSIRKAPRDTHQGQYDFSPAVVGARYAARLRALWSQHAAIDANPAPSVHAPPQLNQP